MENVCEGAQWPHKGKATRGLCDSVSMIDWCPGRGVDRETGQDEARVILHGSPECDKFRDRLQPTSLPDRTHRVIAIRFW